VMTTFFIDCCLASSLETFPSSALRISKHLGTEHSACFFSLRPRVEPVSTTWFAWEHTVEKDSSKIVLSCSLSPWRRVRQCSVPHVSDAPRRMMPEKPPALEPERAYAPTAAPEKAQSAPTATRIREFDPDFALLVRRVSFSAPFCASGWNAPYMRAPDIFTLGVNQRYARYAVPSHDL